jgi:hypothetical protein
MELRVDAFNNPISVIVTIVLAILGLSVLETLVALGTVAAGGLVRLLVSPWTWFGLAQVWWQVRLRPWCIHQGLIYFVQMIEIQLKLRLRR